MTIVKKVSASVKKSDKLIVHAHPDPDQHQNVITSRRWPLGHAYRVWSTSVNESV